MQSMAVIITRVGAQLPVGFEALRQASLAARRSGVGRQLAGALIEDAFACGARLRLRATHAVSTGFWDAMGLSRIEADRSSREIWRARA